LPGTHGRFLTIFLEYIIHRAVSSPIRAALMRRRGAEAGTAPDNGAVMERQEAPPLTQPGGGNASSAFPGGADRKASPRGCLA
jgi:hypothetical protein